jgi:DNA-binding NarL/FixJ family response regulator
VAAGEVIFVIALNCFIIFLLYKFQQKSLEKRMKHLKNEIQELEDLVAAIIEEFQEIAQVTEAQAEDAKNAILQSTSIIESDESTPKQQTTHLYNETDQVGIQDRSEIPAFQNVIPEASTDSTNEAEVAKPSLPGRNVRSVKNERHQRILELWEQGISIEEIAKKLGTGRGEVQLILGIYRRS